VLADAPVANALGLADGGQGQRIALRQVQGLDVGQNDVVGDAFASGGVAPPDAKPLVARLRGFGLLREFASEGCAAGFAGRLFWAGGCAGVFGLWRGDGADGIRCGSFERLRFYVNRPGWLSVGQKEPRLDPDRCALAQEAAQRRVVEQPGGRVPLDGQDAVFGEDVHGFCLRSGAPPLNPVGVLCAIACGVVAAPLAERRPKGARRSSGGAGFLLSDWAPSPQKRTGRFRGTGEQGIRAKTWNSGNRGRSRRPTGRRRRVWTTGGSRRWCSRSRRPVRPGWSR
jgi:hypothetical protein